jgi:MtN3 and saliva related transmembrane protein
MTLDPVEALGLFAGLLSTFAAAPQMVKIVRTRSAQDVSLAMFVMAFAGACLWGIYGLLKQAPSIVFWNVVGITMSGAIIALKLRHSPRPDSRGD